MALLTELHPIVAQLSPSEEQVPAVVARGQDVAVTAGAGAGKTRTLVARYLSLLVDGLPLRTIVAITFTKKAAREMRNRVREEVRRYLETPGLAAAELVFWRDIYEQLDAARIGTIHGLCAELLRHHPVEACTDEFSLDPRFDMLDEGQMALLQAQAVDAALAWAADDAEAAHLFADFGARALGTTVARLLSQRLDVADARADLAGATGDLWLAWLPHLAGPLRAFLDDPEVRAGFADLVTWRADGTLARAEAAGDALVPGFRELLAHWDAIEAARACADARARADAARAVGTRDDWGTISRHLAPLRDNLKQKGAKRNWAPADPKPVIKALQVCYDAQVKPVVGGGIDLDLDRRSAQVIVPALLRVFDRALTVYTSSKQARRALDFDDLEARALKLLQEHPDVRAYWQGRVGALLVDEFQDTNGRQRDLLKALNGDAGKLFIVGDGKQSIYRFRGADVSVFREERRAIAGRGLALELATSYRAHAALVASLNTLLRPVLGDHEDPDRPYVEPFAALQHYRTAPAAGLEPPYMELHLTVGSKSDGALDRAARVLAARFVDLVAGGNVTVEDRDEETGQSVVRPLNYGDIAVLCRASSSFAAYEDALELAGIPYLTISGRGFYDRPEVRDLLNALQALADPTDDLALVGLLRSPVCGLSDMALTRLRQAQRSRRTASLWATLLEDDLTYLEGEVTPAMESRDLIARLHALVGRVPVAAVLKAFLDATSYQAALLRAGQARASGNVAKLLADAHASEIVGVGAFAAYMAELRDVTSREGEARVLASGAVQIMTVHQAKGLEFPVVVIGDAAHGDPRSSGVLIDAALGVVPPLETEIAVGTGDTQVREVTSAAYLWAKAREGDQQAAESARLLYVAATRAREMLLISGTVGASSRGVLSTRGWLESLGAAMDLKGATPKIDADADRIHRFTCDLGGQEVACTIYEPEAALPGCGIGQAALPLVGAAAGMPDPVMLAPVGAPKMQPDAAVEDAERDPPRRVWRVVPPTDRARAPAWVVGQIVHMALGAWMFPDGNGGIFASGDIAPGQQLDRAAARRRFNDLAEAEAFSCGLTNDDEVTDAVLRAARMLAHFQDSSLYEEMAAAPRRLHEVPYSILDDAGKVDSGVIDALYRSGDDWVLVEFKTDTVKDEAALDALMRSTDYAEQVARYRGAAARLLGAQVRAAVCFLNFGGRSRVVGATSAWR